MSDEIKNGRPGMLYIGTVLVGEYAGFEFSFLGLRSMAPFFSPSGISLSAHEKTLTHRGCRFRHGLPGEKEKDFPVLSEEIKKDIVEILRQRKESRKPATVIDKNLVHIIGTVRKGRYTGTQFSFVQLKNAPLFFNMYNVSRVINGVIATYRGCSFRKATYEEAKPYYNNFTQEVADDLRMMFQPTTQIWAIPVRGKYKDVKFLLRENKEIQQFFSPTSIYKIITGRNKEHLRCSFALVKPEDDREKHRAVLTQKIFYEIQDELTSFFICTLREWPFEGIEIGFVSRRVTNRYFNLNSVKKVLTGKIKHYKKCTFRTATYEEAAALVDNLTPDIADYLS